MFTVRRWWDRHGSQIIITGVVLGTAWFLRETQGAAIAEIYHRITHPFGVQPTPEEQLTNARILELEAQLAEVEGQKQKLESLIQQGKEQEEAVIIAPIIARSADHWWQQVTIGRGSEDGIQEGFVVSGIGGLVGRVIEVTPNTSRVLLISDSRSRVGVVVSRNRQMGFLRGQGSDRVVMQFFEKVPDIRPGDTVVTSQLSRLFPAGIPVGQVESVNLEGSPAPEAIIKFTAPISNLEWVYVHPFSVNSQQ